MTLARKGQPPVAPVLIVSLWKHSFMRSIEPSFGLEQYIDEWIDTFLRGIRSANELPADVAELVRDMPAAKATSLLVALLDRETHPNVCGAAVEVLTELGTPDALPMLRKVLEKLNAQRDVVQLGGTARLEEGFTKAL